MNYISIREASEKWKISDRRIRVLCSEGRIEGAVKVGRSWSIPSHTVKPADGREGKRKKYIGLDYDFCLVDSLKEEIDTYRPLSVTLAKSLHEKLVVEWTYNSNAIEGNTLTEDEKEWLNKFNEETIKNYLYMKLKDYFKDVTDYFSPEIIGEVNDVYVKIARIRGDKVPWHNHGDEDELFYIIEGSLFFEIEGKDSFVMNEGDIFIVKKGINHRVSSISLTIDYLIVPDRVHCPLSCPYLYTFCIPPVYVMTADALSV